MLATVADRSQIAESRRLAAECARRQGFDEQATARIALVATEMATNLLKHAERGEILINVPEHGGAPFLELLSLDSGRGIADIGEALRVGASSAGTPGTGLGAIRRQSDEFAIWSRPERGTAVMARFGRKANGSGVTLAAIAEPYRGETICGDSWRFAATEAGPALLMVDGSGHGSLAAAAAASAGKAFLDGIGLAPVPQMEAIHRALAPTRGAAVAIARLDLGARLVRFVGIGNIGGALLTQDSVKRMVSHNGIAGHVAGRIREFTYPYEGKPTVILHSDGLSAKWDFARYPGLAASHPAVIAGVLFRDHRRVKDDAAVLVLRVET